MLPAGVEGCDENGGESFGLFWENKKLGRELGELRKMFRRKKSKTKQFKKIEIEGGGSCF